MTTFELLGIKLVLSKVVSKTRARNFFGPSRCRISLLDSIICIINAYFVSQACPCLVKSFSLPKLLSRLNHIRIFAAGSDLNKIQTNDSHPKGLKPYWFSLWVASWPRWCFNTCSYVIKCSCKWHKLTVYYIHVWSPRIRILTSKKS